MKTKLLHDDGEIGVASSSPSSFSTTIIHTQDRGESRGFPPLSSNATTISVADNDANKTIDSRGGVWDDDWDWTTERMPLAGMSDRRRNDGDEEVNRNIVCWPNYLFIHMHGVLDY